MISQSLVTAKGSIEALISLSKDGNQTSASLSDTMDVSEGTARDRLDSLVDAGLVTEEAELRDERPVRVYEPTDDGENLANSLVSILDDYATDGTQVSATTASAESTSQDADNESDTEA